MRDFDLQFVGVGQVVDRYAKPTRGDLFDGRAFRITVGQRLEASGIFATFACVALTAEAVHGDGERLVCFSRNRTERHRTGAETLHDFLSGLHFVDGNWPTISA